MRFLLQLITKQSNQRLTFNYHYPLGAAKYKIIERAHETYAHFLHEQGYKHGGKSFKFFTFSDLQTPFTREADKMVMATNTAHLTIGFEVPDAAENFIKGLFMNQQIDIADSSNKASFIVEQVNSTTKQVFTNNKILTFQPMSPLVVGRSNERGNDDYVSPEEPDFSLLFNTNLISKYGVLQHADQTTLLELSKAIIVQPLFLNTRQEAA